MSGTKVQLDPHAVKSLEKKAQNALAKTAYVLQDEIRQAQIIPRDTGHLQNEGFIVDISQVDKGLVRLGHSSDVPYALRLYLHPEYNFNRDKNPNAQGMWFRPWLKHGEKSKRVREIYEELLKREI
jgi:hypothetical protein